MRRSPTVIAATPFDGVRWLAAGALVAVCAFAALGPARAEDAKPTHVTADANLAPAERDRALLAEYGIELARIEQTDDVAKLWRVVRELVLPGRVSEATQQRILRRVWLIDTAIRDGSRVESQVN